ncbi:hypothetical protein GGR54DRAFT_634204 [Hypoxylon sp. NC1633]|nr:hypothetical protein GGR54DRAFT_634204 [Hypoxylon sp. NC1633]
MESMGLTPWREAVTEANRVQNFDPVTVRRDALNTRIVVHGRFPELVERFLKHKRQHGTAAEKKLYTSDWSWRQQVARLLQNRAVVFMGSADYTELRNGDVLPDGRKFWDSVGTDGGAPLAPDGYLTYDEIMLGSLLGVSGSSHFINDGNRYNNAVPGANGTFEPRGIIIGLVGSRFERPEHMDGNFILKNKNSRQHPELTGIFMDFFGVSERSANDFDLAVYTARIRITANILLLEAEHRARDERKKAYVYIVGLGLGVWAVQNRQPDYYVQAFYGALLELKERLTHIATLEFAYLNVPLETQRTITAIAADQNITVKFSRRAPAAKLPPSEADQLLVLSYAWDANAFPGNEYWHGSLSASGDPAAACMSTIAELHNPIINPDFVFRIAVLEDS